MRSRSATDQRNRLDGSNREAKLAKQARAKTFRQLRHLQLKQALRAIERLHRSTIAPLGLLNLLLTQQLCAGKDFNLVALLRLRQGHLCQIPRCPFQTRAPNPGKFQIRAIPFSRQMHWRIGA